MQLCIIIAEVLLGRFLREIAGIRMRMLRKRAEKRSVRIIAAFRMCMLVQTTQRRLLFQLLVAVRRVRMLRQRTDQKPIFAVAVRAVRVCFQPADGLRARIRFVRGVRFIRGIRRADGQDAVAEDRGVVQGIGFSDDAAANIALRSCDRFGLCVCDDADMVGKAVAVSIKEDKVARPWSHRSGGGIESRGRQLLCPVDAAGGIGEDGLLDACIVQTERGKHGAPFAIWIAEPRAVARIAVNPAVFIHGIVAAALRVAKLAVCDCRDICSQIVREILRDCPLPYGGGLQVGFGV